MDMECSAVAALAKFRELLKSVISSMLQTTFLKEPIRIT